MSDLDPLDHLAAAAPPDPVRGHFLDDLRQLDRAMIAAGETVAAGLPPVLGAFLRGDRDGVDMGRDLAQDVAARCRLIEDRCLVLIAREAPVGRDLRRVVALLRLTPRLERAVQLTRHVPEALVYLDPPRLPPELHALLDELATAAADVFTAGVAAWRRQDPLALPELEAADGQVDRLQRRLVERAVATTLEPSANVALGLLGRYLERIGDHGVAFARDTAFVVTGERVQVGV